MPRAVTKKPRIKKGPVEEPLPETLPIEAPAAVAVEEPPPVESSELRPPTTPIETQEAERTDRPVKVEKRGGPSDKDHITSSRKTRSGLVSCFRKVCWRFCRKVLVSCARKVSITSRARKIFTFRHRKSAASICKPAT